MVPAGRHEDEKGMWGAGEGGLCESQWFSLAHAGPRASVNCILTQARYEPGNETQV